MCGIAGWVGNPANRKVSFRISLLLQALLLGIEKRGTDGTGFVLFNGDYPRFRKKAIKASDFIDGGYASDLFRGKYTYALLHARAASDKTTLGQDRNCHPFLLKLGEKRYSFGIHNGTVSGSGDLASKYGIHAAAVDSETMFKAIASCQMQGRTTSDSISEVIAFLDWRATMACAYLDAGHLRPDDRVLYLWRTQGRPLYIIDARKYGYGRFFCSTMDIFEYSWRYLRGILGPIDGISYFEAKPYRLYKVAADGANEVDTVKDIFHTWPLPHDCGEADLFEAPIYDQRCQRQSTSFQFWVAPWGN